MSRKQLFIPTKKITLTILSIVLILFISIIIINFFSAFRNTRKAINHAQDLNFTQATLYSKNAYKFPKIVSILTFGQFETIEAWVEALEIINLLPQFESEVNKLGNNLFTSQPQTSLHNIQLNVEIINQKLKLLQKNLANSTFLAKSKYEDKIDSLIKVTNEVLISFDVINTDRHTFLVLLQNTDEIRPSGGFMGSYARIDLSKGKIENLTIQDIYEPDGQFIGFVDAPFGAKQYLSGGKGLRLPDSNWHPDLPTSAKITSSYFAFGDERTIDSIVTLNVEVVEKILKITGEVFLPDYGITVTSDNLSAIARSDRNSFFAGSKQKINFLSALLDHLKIKFSNLSTTEQKNIANLLLISLQNKDLQLFSWHPSLQNIYDEYNFAGEIEYRDQSDYYLYLVESNVGINKANKNILRTVNLDIGKNRTDIVVNFENNSEQISLDYINYQRLLLSPQVDIENINYDSQEIEFHEEIITNSHGNQFKEIGFLLPLKSGESKTLQITTTHNLICQQLNCKVQIQKQSGLPPIPYMITFEDQVKNIILEKDEVISFEVK